MLEKIEKKSEHYFSFKIIAFVFCVGIPMGAYHNKLIYFFDKHLFNPLLCIFGVVGLILLALVIKKK